MLSRTRRWHTLESKEQRAHPDDGGLTPEEAAERAVPAHQALARPTARGRGHARMLAAVVLAL